MQEAIAEANAEQPSEHTANESKDSDEDEWEEETRYIVLDLGTEVTSETVQAAAASHEGVSIVGLDSSAPHLRVGNLVFRGTLDRTLGTDLIFATSKHDDARPQRAPRGPLPLSTDLNRPGIDMTFVGQSTVRAKFTRVSLERRQPPGDMMDVDAPSAESAAPEKSAN
ncbi:hypothetical protein PhCBS80983_g04842 [Powellomyces hirtus]|uniref:Transcription factor TFIIIC triple barrel domain-containing protein n=1 Tax=Powellomyces hirtus TaxID=109895 RepID=A0A507DX43_9FUNG|nr:hypothetical protein PhCBS80983_g04842 [Powellomyces hirtus]